jgi:hypothetical protein
MSEENGFDDKYQFKGEPKILNRIEEGDEYEICDILEEKKGGIYLQELEKAILKTNNIYQIYEFAYLASDMNVVGHHKKEFAQKIIDSKNPKLMCYYMEFVDGNNIKEALKNYNETKNKDVLFNDSKLRKCLEMLKELKNTKCSKYMEMLIDDDEYEDVKNLIDIVDSNYEAAIEAAKEYDWLPESLSDYRALSGDINALTQAVVSSNDAQKPNLLTDCANYIQYLESKNSEKASASNSSTIGNTEDNSNIENESVACVNKLAEALIDTKDLMNIYEFLASVKMADDSNSKQIRNNLIKEIVDSENLKFKYYVLGFVPDITDEEKDIIKDSVDIVEEKIKNNTSECYKTGSEKERAHKYIDLIRNIDKEPEEKENENEGEKDTPTV